MDIEKELNNKFSAKNITEQELKAMTKESAELYGKLRNIHLAAHLEIIDILAPAQVSQYNELRGYSSVDPCESIPEGHDPEIWKLHNNCN